MATLIVIPNWERDFENSKSRQIENANFFCVQNGFDGRRMRRLQKLEQALPLYGAFHVICAIASKCPYRGVLLDDHGPLTANDIAEKSGFDTEHDVSFFRHAIETLADPAIAILQKFEIDQADDGTWTLPGAVCQWAIPPGDRRRSRSAGGDKRQSASPPDRTPTRGDAERHAGPHEANGAGAAPRHLPTRGDAERHAATRTEQNGTEPKVPPAVPQGGPQPQHVVADGVIYLPKDQQGRDNAIRLAIRLICKKILGGKDPSRPWSRDAMDRLTQLLQSGLPMAEIDRIGWWRSLPKATDVPELASRRDPITETGLMNYWGDELARANDYWAKTHRGELNSAAKKEPPRWREFFQWKAGHDDIRLPKTFHELDPDQRAEYERDFATFEEGVPA